MRRTHRRMALPLALSAALAGSLAGCGTLQDVPMPPLVGGDKYEVTAVFGNVLGLPPQAPVKMDGATIGEVSEIATVDYTARVLLQVSTEYPLPADVHAEIRFGSPMGEAFIELSDPSGGADARLGEGGVIPQSATSQAPSIGDLLSATSTLVTGGSFADMKTVITELNTALTGNSGNIRHLVAQLDGMVTRLNQHTAQFDVALTSLDRLSRGLAADRALIGESLQKLEPAVRTLSAERKQILTLLAELRRLSRTATGTLTQTRADMLSVLADLGPVLENLQANQAEFHQILAGIHDFGVATDSAMWGAFLNFDLTTIFDADALSTLGAVSQPRKAQR